MYVWYLSDWSDTEASNKSPPFPEPERALNMSMRKRETVEEVSRRRLEQEDGILGLEVVSRDPDGHQRHCTLLDTSEVWGCRVNDGTQLESVYFTHYYYSVARQGGMISAVLL